MTTTLKNKLNGILALDENFLLNFLRGLILNLIDIYKHLEPIPMPSDVQVKNIYDVLLRSNYSYSGREVYQTYSNKLAFIFYSITKSHFLENGNKRVAARIFTFLILLDLSMDKFELEFIGFVFKETAEKAIFIAESKPEDKDHVISILEDWVDELIKKLYS